MEKNEHSQQCYFAQQLIADHFIFNLKNIPYKLVCWELMCEERPFRINRNKAFNGAKKYPWNASIDFILYSEEKNKFIFIEMKNYLKPFSTKNILKAFLQTTYSSIMFKKNYDKKELYEAMANCFLGAKGEEGGEFLRNTYQFHKLSKIEEHINLPKNNNFQIDRYIMPFIMQNSSKIKKGINELNSLKSNGLVKKINSYSKKSEKEITRFLKLETSNPEIMNHFIENENPLEIFEIKNNYKNLISEYEKWTDNSSELIPKLKY